MRDKDLLKVWEAINVGIELFQGVIEAGANESYIKDQRKMYRALNIIQKDRLRLAKRRGNIAANREKNRQYKEDMEDYNRNRF